MSRRPHAVARSLLMLAVAASLVGADTGHAASRSPLANCLAAVADLNTGADRLPAQSFALVAPEVCALARERRLTRSDGSIDGATFSRLIVPAIERVGVARFQTVYYGELAVSKYHLVKPGHVTAWARCVALGYGGLDGALAAGAKVPPRDLVRRAVRNVCTRAIAEGILPPTGVAATGTRAGNAFGALLMAELLELEAHG